MQMMAWGDMRQAVKDLQSTWEGFRFVSGHNVFSVVASLHPVKVQAILKACLEMKVDAALEGLQELWGLAYSSHDVVSSIFRVTKRYARAQRAGEAGVYQRDWLLSYEGSWKACGHSCN